MSKRSLVIRSMMCIACRMHGRIQFTPTTEHHLNLGGRAGQKRRGDEFSIPLCIWHHQGEPIEPWDATQCARMFGPSLARQSKEFRKIYGTDDELLMLTNREIERLAA